MLDFHCGRVVSPRVGELSRLAFGVHIIFADTVV